MKALEGETCGHPAPRRRLGLLATTGVLVASLTGCSFLQGGSEESAEPSTTVPVETSTSPPATSTPNGTESPSESGTETATSTGTATQSESSTAAADEASATAAPGSGASPTTAATAAGGLTDPSSLTGQLGAALVPSGSTQPAIHTRGQGRATLVGDIPQGARTLLVATTCSPAARITLRYTTTSGQAPSIIQPGQCGPATLAATAIALPDNMQASTLNLTVEVPGTTQFWVLAQPGN